MVLALLGVGLALLLVLRSTLGDGAAGLLDTVAGDPLLVIPTTVLDQSPHGRLSWTALMATLGSSQGEWRRCAAPEVVGTVRLALDLAETGAVIAARVEPPEAPLPVDLAVPEAVERCALAAVVALRFGPPVGGAATVRFALHFEPGRPAP